jgi:L-ascorbate metabolism protein UlaG (beta-lactamase superfamily)
MIVLVSVLVAIGALTGLYLWYPPFGGRTPKRTFFDSDNHDRRTFQNGQFVLMSSSLREWLSFFWRQVHGREDRRPAKPLEAATPDFEAFQANPGLQIIWLGHSTLLARIGGQTILFDPVFSKRASPFQWIGPKRFDTTPRLKIEELPPIDAVVISHDHYDHLDYHSIKDLRDKAQHFFVPLGLGSHLKRWGISEGNITELDWWQETTYNNLTLACTPTQHFSGRTLTDRAATLWGSWVVVSDAHRVFFSGDGGYNTHFKQIGKKYGPFDLTLLECGQYDPLWANVHMTPEQTVQAHLDLRGKLMIPIHWGAFVLALHTWTEPVARALAAAQKAKSIVITPRLGERISIPLPAIRRKRPLAPWWQS